jgi:hypothetical protein
VERFERPRTPATPLFTGVPANPWKVEPFFENLFFLENSFVFCDKIIDNNEIK